MTLVVDPWHWLTPEGEIPSKDPRLRRNTLRVARIIEYGATLPVGRFRETLVECSRRPAGARCQGLLCVRKRTDEALLAFCPACGTVYMLVHNWKGTRWSNGQAQSVQSPRTPDREGF